MSEPSPSRLDPQRRLMLRLLWAALAIWILLLAIGASLYAPAPGDRDSATVDWRRGVVVLIFVGGFLGGWMILAKRRLRRK